MLPCLHVRCTDWTFMELSLLLDQELVPCYIAFSWAGCELTFTSIAGAHILWFAWCCFGNGSCFTYCKFCSWPYYTIIAVLVWGVLCYILNQFPYFFPACYTWWWCNMLVPMVYDFCCSRFGAILLQLVVDASTSGIVFVHGLPYKFVMKLAAGSIWLWRFVVPWTLIQWFRWCTTPVMFQSWLGSMAYFAFYLGPKHHLMLD